MDVQVFAPWLTAGLALVIAVSAWIKRTGASDSDFDHHKRTLDKLCDDFEDMSRLVTALQVKVDTMWDFTLRRAKLEAVNQGLAEMNSPIHFTPQASLIIAPFARQLRDMYEKLGPISDNDLAVEIERLFGQDLLTKVCIPFGLFMGACLVIAMAAAKGELICPDVPTIKMAAEKLEKYQQ